MPQITFHNHIPPTPRSLVWDGGRGKHPRSMTAKTLTFPEKAAWLGPISSTCTWTHMPWDTNRVNEMSMGSFRALLLLGSQNSSGMPCKTRTFRKTLQLWHAKKAKRRGASPQKSVPWMHGTFLWNRERDRTYICTEGESRKQQGWLYEKSTWKLFPGTKRSKKCLGTPSIELQMANHV